MAALALIAAIAGGPLGMCLALAYGVVHFVKLTKVDAQYAAKGEMPPSARLIDKWLEGRKARGKAPADAKPAKYGMWRYFWQRWAAMWEVLTEGHKIKHEQYLKDRAAALREGRPKPKRPSMKEQARAGWQWMVDVLGKPVGGTTPTGKTQPPAASRPHAESTHPAADGPVITCDDCGATLVDADGGHQHPAGSRCGKAWPAPAASPDQSGGAGQPSPTGIPAQPGPAEAGSPVISEGDNMPAATQVSGEVTGIPTAVGYLNQMAAIHRSHADNENLCTTLAGFRVGAADIDLVRAAIAASSDAADLYAHAAKTLDDNNAGVRQGYASAPQAADKQAQLAE